MNEANTTQVSIGFDGPPQPKWLFYVLSFFLPVAGVIMAAIFSSIADQASKDFGKICLILAVIPIALLILFYVGYIILVIVYIIIIAVFGVAFGTLADMSVFGAIPGL